jgi:hypothetical protein
MITDGLSYPVAGDSALSRLVVGTLLSVASFLVLPAIALLGYLVRVLASAAHDEPAPPAFDNWGKMFVTGLKATVVTVVYGIAPLGLVGGLAVSGTFLTGVSGADSPAGLLLGFGLIGGLLALVVSFLIYYLVPAALANMAVEGRVGAAFDFGQLAGVLTSGEYLLAWLVPFALSVVVNVVSVLLAITVVGIVFVPVLQFYVQVAAFFMFGRAFGNVTGVAAATGSRGQPTV